MSSGRGAPTDPPRGQVVGRCHGSAKTAPWVSSLGAVALFGFIFLVDITRIGAHMVRMDCGMAPQLVLGFMIGGAIAVVVHAVANGTDRETFFGRRCAL